MEGPRDQKERGSCAFVCGTGMTQSSMNPFGRAQEELARSTKRNFYLFGVPRSDFVTAAQLDVKEGGIRGEFACVKWHWKDVGRKTDGVHFDFRLSVGTILHFSLSREVNCLPPSSK